MGPVRTVCMKVAELPTAKLESCYLGRAFPLKEVIPRLERLQWMIRTISSCLAVEEIPQEAQNRINNPVAELDTWFTHVTGVPDNHQNPRQEYDQSRRRFDQVESMVHTDALPAFAIAAGLESGLSRKSMLEAFTRDIADVQAQAKTDLEEIQAQAREDLEKIQASLTAAEQSAVQADKARERAAADATIMAISAQQSRFSGEVARHRRHSYGWLAAASLLALLAAGFAYQVWIDARDAAEAAIFAGGSAAVAGPPTGLSVQLVTSKIAVMALLVSFTFWAGRMYRAALHNQIVNQHRSNALATFETFVDGATPDIRSAVLLQTTSCIFAAQPTGLISTESEPHPMAYLADFARAVGTSSPGGTQAPRT